MTVRVDALAAVRKHFDRRLLGLDDPHDPVVGPVVVACSGGSDSLTLLAVAAERGLDPIAVHVDHGLRAGSADESAVVADAARRLDAAFDAVHVDVAHGPNLEARARAARYAALGAAADRHGAGSILVGHTADDQAETVLLALLRGSAGPGLAGMPVRRGRIVRPLLGVRRVDTEACALALGVDPVRDPTNDDRSFRRAWIRHDVLPLLAAGAGRDLVPVLVRQAEVLRDESDYLDSLARAAWPPSADQAPASLVDAASGISSGACRPGRQAPATVLARLPRPLARRAVRCWLGSPPPSFDEVERVLAVAAGAARATELAGGRRVRRTRGQLVLGRTSSPPN
jgi:tRNA(Ile)-lysidine synthase